MKVSAVCLTADNPQAFASAVDLFRRQSLPPELRELVVVDGSAGATMRSMCEAATRDGVRVRYQPVGSRMLPWEALNLACSRATGDYLAAWGETDWHHPRRLALQLQALLDHRKDLCDLPMPPLYDARTGYLWVGRGPGVLPGTAPRVTTPAGWMIHRGLWKFRQFSQAFDGWAMMRLNAGLGKAVCLSDPYPLLMHNGDGTACKDRDVAWLLTPEDLMRRADEATIIRAPGYAEVNPRGAA